MRVLFLGEGPLDGPARYLAAILKKSRISFDHRPDEAQIPQAWRKKAYAAIILSDYRYSSFAPRAREWLVNEVKKGTGLLMIGGWASFTGLVGGYAGTEIEKLLPVTCERGDDRVQKATGALLLPAHSSFPAATGREPIKALCMGPPPEPAGDDVTEWHSGFTDDNPPVICGYHRAKPKPGTATVAIFRDLLYKDGRVRLGESHPALVLGTFGLARTAAFLTDCAPHWAGGLVDWGQKRLTVRAAPGVSVEVGEQYVRFFQQLIQWVSAK